MKDPAELRQSLDMPIIGGELVALYAPVERPLHVMLLPDDFSWRVEIIFNGPDARFKPASVYIDEHHLAQFLEALSGALSKLTLLKAQKFSGIFSTVMPQFLNPRIEVKAEDGRCWANIWVSNRNWQFSRQLDIERLTQVVDALVNVPTKGVVLVEHLKKLVAGS